MVRITVALDEATAARIRLMAARLRKPHSQILREAVRHYVERPARPNAPAPSKSFVGFVESRLTGVRRQSTPKFGPCGPHAGPEGVAIRRRDPALGRPVAVSTRSPTDSADAPSRRRF
jgi:hypothetical protein